MADAKIEPRLKKQYFEVVRKALLEEFKYDNEMQIPRITKVVLNMGVGEATAELQEANCRSRRSGIDCWSEAGYYPCAQFDRYLQGA